MARARRKKSAKSKKRSKKSGRRGKALWLKGLLSLFKGGRKYLLILVVLMIGGGFYLHDAGLQTAVEKYNQAFIDWTAERGLTVRHLKVKGRQNVATETLMALINIRYGDPILFFDPDTVQKQLEAVDWIKQARVERHLPDTILITLNERTPQFLYQENNQLRPMDANGYLLPVDAVDRYRTLPILIGSRTPDDIRQARDIIRNHPDLLKDLKAMVRIANRRWDITLAGDLRIKLPEKDHNLALSRLQKIQAETNILNKDLAMIDLRMDDRLIIRPSRRANLLIDRPAPDDQNGEKI